MKYLFDDNYTGDLSFLEIFHCRLLYSDWFCYNLESSV